ncbi:MAG TPA: tRNA (adenosine(37)-N6)-threonylcarbamoyltransferase complex ATPase subunit type 1 TsaE [bacterium]|nr:tRNA (adenosine(37)-N6)-threonylcarbamoyltransferase complex ATPase subunit type 1 TsaE [bacterium]
MIRIETESAAQTAEIGALLGAVLPRGMFVGLSGDLGGGKTTFTQGLARGLGVRGNVTSPTFQLVREYKGRERLFHFDFYRLDSGSDLLDLDIPACLKEGVVAAEWADLFEVPDIDQFILMQFTWTGEECRFIDVISCSEQGSELMNKLVSEKQFGAKVL